MKVIMNYMADENIKNKSLLCTLLEERIKIILGQFNAININSVVFCDVLMNQFRIEKNSCSTYNIYIDKKILLNSIQAGGGQEIFDETILLIKKQIVQ